MGPVKVGWAPPLWEEQASHTQIWGGGVGGCGWGHGLLHSKPITLVDEGLPGLRLSQAHIRTSCYL